MLTWTEMYRQLKEKVYNTILLPIGNLSLKYEFFTKQKGISTDRRRGGDNNQAKRKNIRKKMKKKHRKNCQKIYHHLNKKKK